LTEGQGTYKLVSP